MGMTDLLIPVSPHVLLSESAEELETIRTAAGREEVHFDAYFLPVLKAYAAYVQRLPLTSTLFSDPGGAWEYGLIMSILTLRVAETKIFFMTSSEERRILEKQARFAAFVAGLATGVALAAEHSRVTGKIDGEFDEYHALTAPGSLHSWLNVATQPDFRWRPDAPQLSRSECAAIAARFVPAGLLRNFDLRIGLMVFDAVLPREDQAGHESTLAKVVRLSAKGAQDTFIEREKSRFKLRAHTGASGSGHDIQSISDALVASQNLSPARDPLGDETPAMVRAKPKAANPSDSAGTEDEGDRAAGDALLAGAHEELQEWFKAFIAHPVYGELRKALTVGPSHIALPIIVLGKFGLNAKTVLTHLNDANMVMGKTPDQKSLLLPLSLKHLLIKEGP